MAVQPIAAQMLTPLPSSSGGIIPGDAATGHLQRSVDKFFKALEPRKTEFLNKIKKGEAKNQVNMEWGQKFFRPLSTLTAATQSSSATTLTVTTGDYKIFQQYMVIRIIDATAGDEVEWLSTAAPTTEGALTGLQRAQGTTSAVQHASGCTVEIIGIAVPYGVDHPTSPIQRGSLVNNKFQRFAGSITADKAELVTPDWENMPAAKMAQLIREEAANQKYMLQKAILYGTKQAASNSTTPKTPGMMGGWREYVTSHVLDMQNKPISIWDIDDLAAEAWEQVTDYTADTLVMSNTTKRAFARRVSPLRELTSQERSIDFRLDSVMLDGVGEVSLMVVPEFPEGEIWGVNFDTLSYHPYEGLDWHFGTLPASGDYEWEAVSGDFSFKVDAEHAQFRIHSINTNLNLYPKGMY